MTKRKGVSLFTACSFLFFVLTAYAPGAGMVLGDDDTIARLLIEAENSYKNGQFKEAISIYQKIIDDLKEKKELAETRQDLFKTMISLAFTYFTIQETDKARSQLHKLIELHPNQDLDVEIYPPAFARLFQDVQKSLLGQLVITTEPEACDVKIDSQAAGKTPLTLKNILRGDHTITAEKKGFLPRTEPFSVKAGETNSLSMILTKAEEIAVIEKEGVKKQRRKISPLVFIGGAALVGVGLLLLLKKDSTPAEEVVSRPFSNNVPVTISVLAPSFSTLEVSGIPKALSRVEYNLRIDHPRIEDLIINLIAPDNRTVLNLWNHGPHEENGKTFSGTSEIFNTVAANGVWKVSVTNRNERLTGTITRWTLTCFYKK